MDLTGLDWGLAARAGLTAREVDILGFFADVEGQTAYYMLEVAKLEVARDATLLTFLTMWNYEELFHARALNRLLEACGHAPPDDIERKRALRSTARLKAKLEDLFQTALARVAPDAFTALWMAWGAAQELVTTMGYEQLARNASNPVARELCRRIAQQERRHFAWYYASARERLDGRPGAQWLVRQIFERAWSPVGSGVKTPDEFIATLTALFPDDAIHEGLAHIDERMGKLPGLGGLRACRRWAERVMLPHAPAVAALAAFAERAAS